jgi:hypothetical protein
MTGRWQLLRVLLTAHVSYALILAAPVVVLSALIVGGIAIWGEVDRSVWHYLATQAPRWLALGLGVDAVATYLRINLAHGRTRRDFLRQLGPYFVGLAAALGAIVTIGYQVERGFYAVFGWDQRLVFTATYGDTGNVLGMLGAHSLSLLPWVLAGTMIAAAFARNVVTGALTVLFGLLLVAPTEALVGLNGTPLFEKLTEHLTFPVAATVAVCLGGAALQYAATWGIVRDIPLRVKVA